MELFGEILVQHKIISKKQLLTALQTQKKDSSLALGDIISRDYSVDQQVIETLFVNEILTPFLKVWFMNTFKEKLQIKGVDFSLFISELDINISLFTRTTANQITFIRDKNGQFCPNKQDRVEEQVNAVIDTMTIRTIRKQILTFTDIGITVNLFSKNLKLNDGPGFISAARIRLMQALKKKS